MRAAEGAPSVAASWNTQEPKLCPDPTPEPKRTTSTNSIAYQEYVSGLPYGLAITFGGVIFDGCDPTTGNLLEAKANIDFMFDERDNLHHWINQSSNPAQQMNTQATVALPSGRLIVWHAQTEAGYRGLSNLAKGLPFKNLQVVFDPN